VLRDREGVSMRRLAFAAVLLALVCLWPAGVVETQPGRGRSLPLADIDGRQAVAGEVLVALVAGAPPRTWDEIRTMADGESARPAGRLGVRRVRSRSLDTARLRERLSGHPLVRYAEPNWIVEALDDPGDPLAPQLWGLLNTGQSVNGGQSGVAGADINAAAAWTLSTGAPQHVVGVVDTGIDYTHPDLAPNLWRAPAAFTVTVEGQPITCPAGSYGFDAIARTCDPMDDHNHGTHVAGTIGAAGGNGVGVVGVNWHTRMMALRFMDGSGRGTVADAIAAIEFAIETRRAFAATGAADVRVLSNSWGSRSHSQALADAIAAADSEDMLFVAAAGNDGFSNDLLPLYPASYALPNVIAVAATTNADARAYFSNYGAASVHLGAPGVDILSTVRGNSYGFASGTSMATPHVSGAAALVLSRCPLDTASLKTTLLTTVEAVSALASMTITGGRLDVHGAMRSCVGPPDQPSQLAAVAGDRRVDLTWSSAAGATRYTVARSLTSGGPYTDIASDVTTRTFRDSAVANDTTYYYVVRGANTFGDGPQSPEAAATPKSPSDLIVSAMTAPAVAGAGDSVTFSATTRNQGVGHAAATVTGFYLSANALADASDVVLGSVAVPALAPGAAASATLTAQLPSPLATGTYYVVILADADAAESEPSESNNDLARSIRIGPDLTTATLTVPATAAPGGAIVVSDVVRNQGGGRADATTTRFYLSVNSTFDASDVVLTASRAVPALAPDQSSTGSTTLQIPASTTTGSYYVIARADADGALGETSETNNSAARSLKVGSDLVVSLVAPVIGGAGAAITVTDTVTNQGAGAAPASTSRFYLSENSTIGDGDILLAGSRAVPALAAGATSTGSTTVMLPAAAGTGPYYVVARADADDSAVETNEANNTAARSIAIGPDLRAVTLTVPYQQRSGVASTVSLTVENRGGGAAPVALARFYLSSDTKFDSSDVTLAATATVPSLGSGTQTVVTLSITLPAGTTPGIYYVFARVDADGVIEETQENNNTIWKTVSVLAP
jgi:subtilisin family serine protease